MRLSYGEEDMSIFNIKQLLLPGLLTTGFLSSALLSVKPVRADSLLQDIGVGAATSAVSGKIIHRHDSTVGNAITGAAAGAAVNVTNGKHHKHNLLRDTGVGAAAGVVSGVLTNHRSVLTNAINGAAAGAVVDATHR